MISANIISISSRRQSSSQGSTPEPEPEHSGLTTLKEEGAWFYDFTIEEGEDGSDLSSVENQVSGGVAATDAAPALTPTLEVVSINGQDVKTLRATSGKSLNLNTNGSTWANGDCEVWLPMMLDDGEPPVLHYLFGANSAGSVAVFNIMKRTDGSIQFSIANSAGLARIIIDTSAYHGLLPDGQTAYRIFRFVVSYTKGKLFIVENGYVLPVLLTIGDFSSITGGTYNLIYNLLLGADNREDALLETVAQDKNFAFAAAFPKILSDYECSNVYNYFAIHDRENTVRKIGGILDGVNLKGIHDQQAKYYPALEKEYCFCCGKSNSFASVDITDRSLMRVAWSVTTGVDDCQTVLLDGDIAYIGFDGGFRSYDITDPENLVLLDELLDANILDINGMDRIGTVIVASDKRGYVHRLDISNPSAMTFTTFDVDAAIGENCLPHDVLIFKGRYLALPMQKNLSVIKMALIDATGGGGSILDVGSWTVAGTLSNVSQMNGANRVMVHPDPAHNYMYTANNNHESFSVIDATNPAAMSHVANIKDRGPGHVGLCFCENPNYIIDTMGRGIDVIDITNPTSPTVLASWQDDGGFLVADDADSHEVCLDRHGDVLVGLQNTFGLLSLKLPDAVKS